MAHSLIAAPACQTRNSLALSTSVSLCSLFIWHIISGGFQKWNSIRRNSDLKCLWFIHTSVELSKFTQSWAEKYFLLLGKISNSWEIGSSLTECHLVSALVIISESENNAARGNCSFSHSCTKYQQFASLNLNLKRLSRQGVWDNTPHEQVNKQ